MTLSNPVSSATCQGNGVTTVFDYGFLMPSTASAYLTLYDTISTGLTLSSVIPTTSFTITGIGVTAGGTFTYPTTGSPISTGQVLVLQRVVPLVQETSIANQGKFAPQAVEQALDYLTMITQQQRDAIAALQVMVDNLDPVTQSGTILQINVQDFGATGNGTTDDSAAINAAFAFLRIQQGISPYYASVGYLVYFPAGNYSVSTSINATGFYAILNWGIRGPGKLVGYTAGTPVLDLTDSRWYSVDDDFEIYGAATRTPNVGVLVARGPFGFCDSHVWTKFTTDGSFTVSGFHNYAGEGVHFTKCTIQNRDSSTGSYAQSQDGTNYLGVTSTYLTVVTGGQSFNHNTIETCDFTKPSGGPALFLNRLGGHVYSNIYTQAPGSAGIVLRTTAGNVTSDLVIRNHTEGSGTTASLCNMRFDGDATQTVYGLRFAEMYSQVSTSNFMTGSGVTSVSILDFELRVDLYGSAPSVGMFSPAASFTLNGGRVYCGNNSYNNIASLAGFSGINETDTFGVFMPRTAVRGVSGSSTTPSFSFANDTDTGIYSDAANSFVIATSGSARVYVSAAGALGVNQATPARQFSVFENDSTTNAVVPAARLIKGSTPGVPTAGNGTSLEFEIKTGASTFKVAGAFEMLATDTTTGSEDFDARVMLMAAGAAYAEKMRVSSTGAFTVTGPIGVNGSAAPAKGTITGSRAGNAALASLLTYLASTGLFTDSTTA